ncbi:hypothetical protein KKC94_00060 [Patescibacteria group bacterium]|nr:hypothetical protein [Patescibacteria group bacterium]
MSLTLFALALAPLFLFFVLCPKDAKQALKSLNKDPGDRLVFSWTFILMSFIILGSTGLSALNFQSWNALLPWFGLVVGLKGIVMLLAPKFVEDLEGRFKVSAYPILGFIGLLVVLVLVYVDTQLI